MWHFAHPGNFSKGACGLLKWCFSASRLAALPYMREQRTDVLVVTNDATFVELECAMPDSADVVVPRAIAPDPSVQQLVRKWSAARCKQGTCKGGGMSNAAHAGLLRLQFFGMVQYSAVLVTDLDVDFFLMRQGMPPRPDSSGGRRLELAWTHELGKFLASKKLLMARPDAHSPINTAALLLKPLTRVYALLRNVLQTGIFDPDLGFNRTGRPQHAIGSPAALGLRPSTLHAVQNSMFWRHNDWRFIGGDGDQGLLVHVYIVLLNAWASPRGLWGVHHFFGGDKPWRPTTRCYRYFDFLEHPDLMRRHSEQNTPCRDLFWARHACLHPNNSWATSAEVCRSCKRQRQKSSCIRPPRCSNHLRWAVF